LTLRGQVDYAIYNASGLTSWSQHVCGRADKLVVDDDESESGLI
jgi:hypothetical protein